MTNKITPEANQGKIKKSIGRVALLFSVLILFTTAIFVFGDAFGPGYYEHEFDYSYINEWADEAYYIDAYVYGDYQYMGESCQENRPPDRHDMTDMTDMTDRQTDL